MARGIVRTECKVCRRPTSKVGKLSARGKCAECGDSRMIENRAAMMQGNGPWFDHWRRRTLAAFGVGLDEAASRVDADRDAA